MTNNRLIITILLFCCSLLFAMGENPIHQNNLARQAVIIGPNKTSQARVIDNNLKTGTKLQEIIIDLRSIKYIDEVAVFQKTEPAGIKLSTDIINWSEIIVPTVNNNKEKLYKFSLEGQTARYLKVFNREPAECFEIAVYPFTDYQLKFEEIDARADVNSCEIIARANVATFVQILYGFNYDFIYNQKLDSVFTSLDSNIEHKIKLNNLQPETTYRYQVKLTDHNGNILYSNFFTFTTKATD